MKFKRLCMSFLIFLFTFTPVRANDTTRILLVSDQIPFVIIAELDGASMKVNMIPSNITLPLPDINNYPSALNSLDYTKNIDTLRQSLTTFYNKEIDHVVNIHIEQIAKELDLSLSDYKMSTMSGITDFFEQVSDKIHVSMIFHYKDYITSDMGISQYYDLYQLFRNDVKITYAYASYFIIDDLCLPLDNGLNIKRS